VLHDLPRELGKVARGETARHERLRDRLLTAISATLIVYVIGTVVIYFLERHGPKTEVKTFGDAAFFTAVQLLTISSQLKNPVTAGGRIVDVILEIYALVVVTTLAGMFASFFHRGESAS
jgi:hypothetical protein